MEFWGAQDSLQVWKRVDKSLEILPKEASRWRKWRYIRTKTASWLWQEGCQEAMGSPNRSLYPWKHCARESWEATIDSQVPYLALQGALWKDRTHEAAALLAQINARLKGETLSLFGTPVDSCHSWLTKVRNRDQECKDVWWGGWALNHSWLP